MKVGGVVVREHGEGSERREREERKEGGRDSSQILQL